VVGYDSKRWLFEVRFKGQDLSWCIMPASPNFKKGTKMKLHLKDIKYGVCNEEHEIVALFTGEIRAKEYAKDTDMLACTVHRNDWTSANLNWEVKEIYE